MLWIIPPSPYTFQVFLKKFLLEGAPEIIGFDPWVGKIPLESSILAWRIPWTEKPGGQWSKGLQRGGNN